MTESKGRDEEEVLGPDWWNNTPGSWEQSCDAAAPRKRSNERMKTWQRLCLERIAAIACIPTGGCEADLERAVISSPQGIVINRSSGELRQPVFSITRHDEHVGDKGGMLLSRKHGCCFIHWEKQKRTNQNWAALGGGSDDAVCVCVSLVGWRGRGGRT